MSGIDSEKAKTFMRRLANLQGLLLRLTATPNAVAAGLSLAAAERLPALNSVEATQATQSIEEVLPYLHEAVRALDRICGALEPNGRVIHDLVANMPDEAVDIFYAELVRDRAKKLVDDGPQEGQTVH